MEEEMDPSLYESSEVAYLFWGLKAVCEQVRGPIYKVFQDLCLMSGVKFTKHFTIIVAKIWDENCKNLTIS